MSRIVHYSSELTIKSRIVLGANLSSGDIFIDTGDFLSLNAVCNHIPLNTKGDLCKGSFKGYTFHELQIRDYNWENDK